METFKIEGIILQTNDFGDANRAVTIFTKDFGKLELNVYGCRRAKSPLSGVIQMFNHISAEVSRGSKVDTIRDADLINFYENLTADIERLGYATLFFEIVNKMTLPKFPEPKVFELLKKSLPVLNTRNPKIASVIGICQFMQLSGVQLNFFECVHCRKKITADASISFIDGGAVCNDCKIIASEVFEYPEFVRETFKTMINFDWTSEQKLTFTTKQIFVAEKFFLTYVNSILGKQLNSIKFLQDLGEL